MLIRTEYDTNEYIRIHQNGKNVSYSRTRKRFIFQCDECKTEFSRTTRNYSTEKTDNSKYKHFCKKCEHFGIYVGIENRRKRIVYGSKIVSKLGYVLVRMPANNDYPGKRCGSTVYVREHQQVMQDHLGRKLAKGEVVHHIDGDKANNDLSNLDLCSVKEHNSCHGGTEKLVFLLYKRGLIKYDRDTKSYYLNE